MSKWEIGLYIPPDNYSLVELVQAVVELFRNTLVSAFIDWLEASKNTIGEKWYEKLKKELRKVEKQNTVPGVVGSALWMFSVLAEFGIINGINANIDPEFLRQLKIKDGFDEKKTKRLIALISATLNLQGLREQVNQ